jgi:hypothetical protein
MRYTGRVRPREPHFEQIDPWDHLEYHDPSDFDRIAFTLRALHRLGPSRMKVAVYSAVSALRVESGRDHRRGDDARWAIVGIPPHASREHIAYALATLLGIASVPYAVQILLADEASREDGSDA